jgi:hypothetical protein
MRENRLSGSEGGATLIPLSLPLSLVIVPPGQSKSDKTPGLSSAIGYSFLWT